MRLNDVFCVTGVHIKRFWSIICLAWASSREAEEFSSVAAGVVGGWGRTETCPVKTPDTIWFTFFLPRTKCTMNYLAFQLKGKTLISSHVWLKCSIERYSVCTPRSLTARQLTLLHFSLRLQTYTSTPALYRSGTEM